MKTYHFLLITIITLSLLSLTSAKTKVTPPPNFNNTHIILEKGKAEILYIHRKVFPYLLQRTGFPKYRLL